MLKGSYKRHAKLAIPSYFILLIMVVTASVASTHFRNVTNYYNIINQVAPLAIITLGQTTMMLSGGIDLSVGNLAALTTCVFATFNISIGFLPTLILCIAIGILVGLINGFGVTKLGVPPMIMTLSMMSILKGTSLLISPKPGGTIPEGMYRFFSFTSGPVSTLLILVLISFIAFFILIHMTRFGRYVYAVGGNEINAKRNGINVDKTRIITYILCSLCATIAGIILAARISSGDALIGESFGLDSVTAVVVGGTSMAGGVGGITGVLGGALLVSIISNFLNFLGIDPVVQYIFKGLVLIIALALKIDKKK